MSKSTPTPESALRWPLVLACAIALLVGLGAWVGLRSCRLVLAAARNALAVSPSVPREPSVPRPLARAPLAPPASHSSRPSVQPAPPPKAPTTPWQQVGLCANGAVPRSPVDRASYFASFAQVQAKDTIIFVEPGVSDAAVVDVRGDLSSARAAAENRLGVDAPPPWIYLYASVESLRAHACVNSSAIGYYDGAIHLATASLEHGYGEISRTLRHEYVHHVLIRNGIELPTWFQEGTALLVAGELSWLDWHPAGPMLSSSEMVRAFPETASPDQTQALYGQAFRMVTFLNDLCWRRKDCHFARDLVAALKSGRATPDTLFDWAISERGTDLFATTPLPLWDDYVAHDFSFSRATNAARRRRLNESP